MIFFCSKTVNDKQNLLMLFVRDQNGQQYLHSDGKVSM